MGDSRKKNTARNAVALTFNRITGLLVPFVFRTLIIKVFGEQYLGLSNLFSSILQVLSLADLGFNSAIVYSMYRPIAEHSKEEICALLSLYKKIYTSIGLIILIIGLILIPFLDNFINGEYPKDVNITVLYLIYLGNTVISYLFFADRKALFTAHQRSDIENNINSFTQLFFDVFKIIGILLLENYYVYVLFIPVTTFVSGLITYIYSNKKYPFYMASGSVSRDIKNKIIKRVFALSIQKFGNIISTSLDNIVVSSFIGLTSVAIYGNYFYIVSGVISFIGGGIASATASIGNSVVTKDVADNYSIFKKLNCLNQWCIAWCAPCLLCLYQHFMKIWVGSSLMESDIFVLCMVVFFYITETRKIVQVFKDATGMWWADKWKPIVGCLVNLLLNILLVQHMGLNGVIVSTIVSYLFIEMPWETYVLFKDYLKGYKNDYIKDIIKYFSCILLTSYCGMYLCSFVEDEGIIGFFSKCLICLVESNLIFYFIFRNTNEVKYFKKMFCDF